MAGTLSISAMNPQGNIALARLLPAMGARAWLLGGLLAATTVLAFTSRDTAPLAVSVPTLMTPAVYSSGVVKAIHELAPDNGGARQFEMTIRMRDGTLRVRNETGSARWRPGDKVYLIGTPDPADR